MERYGAVKQNFMLPGENCYRLTLRVVNLYLNRPDRVKVQSISPPSQTYFILAVLD